MNSYDSYRQSLKSSILSKRDVQRDSVDYFFRSGSLNGVSDAESRLATFVASDSKPDRYGDIIHNDGMDTTNFMEGGSILYGHMSFPPEMVMGKPVGVVQSDGKTIVDMEFAPKGLNSAADMVCLKVKSGIIRGSSVGILIGNAVESPERNGFMPMDVLSSDLLELSITPVPVNPRALSVLAEQSKDAHESIEHAADCGDEEAKAALGDGKKIYSLPSGDFIKASIWRDISRALESNQ